MRCTNPAGCGCDSDKRHECPYGEVDAVPKSRMASDSDAQEASTRTTDGADTTGLDACDPSPVAL